MPGDDRPWIASRGEELPAEPGLAADRRTAAISGLLPGPRVHKLTVQEPLVNRVATSRLAFCGSSIEPPWYGNLQQVCQRRAHSAIAELRGPGPAGRRSGRVRRA